MNNKRRDSLREALRLLTNVASIVEAALDKENDCLDNLPDSLRESDRGEKMEEVISNLEEAIDKIDEAVDAITEAIK